MHDSVIFSSSISWTEDPAHVDLHGHSRMLMESCSPKVSWFLIKRATFHFKFQTPIVRPQDIQIMARHVNQPLENLKLFERVSITFVLKHFFNQWYDLLDLHPCTCVCTFASKTYFFVTGELKVSKFYQTILLLHNNMTLSSSAVCG